VGEEEDAEEARFAHIRSLLSSEYGTYKTVQAGSWPQREPFSVRMPVKPQPLSSKNEKCKRVNAGFWPCLSGQAPKTIEVVPSSLGSG
jgi:hypothetical protein